MNIKNIFDRIAIFLLVAVLLSAVSLRADNNVYNATDGAKIPTYVTTATNPANLRSGVPPVGYEGTKGEYTTVKTTRPLPVTAVSSFTAPVFVDDRPYASQTQTVKQAGSAAPVQVTAQLGNYRYITLTATEPFKCSGGVVPQTGSDYQNAFGFPWDGVVPVYVQGVTGTVSVTIRHYGF